MVESAITSDIPREGPGKLPRNEYFDYLKGLLILLVTYGHTIQYIGYGNNYSGFLNDPVFRAIYMFHMPLFMLVSGFLLYRGSQFSFAGQLLKRAKALLIPTLFWSACITIVELAARKATPLDAIALLTQKWSILWYLPTLFLSWLTVALFEVCARKAIHPLRGVLLVALCLFFLYLPENRSVIILYLKFMLPFYCAGYLLAENRQLLHSALQWKWVGIGVSAAAYILCYYFWNQSSYIYGSVSVLNLDNLPAILLRYVAGFAGCALFSYLAYLLKSFLNRPLIREFGKESIYIYITQLLICILSLHIHVNRPAGMGFILYLLPPVAFLLTYLFMLLGPASRKIPILGLLCYGR
jgi:fucose 4-O-acetylase-like acetyltransferase